MFVNDQGNLFHIQRDNSSRVEVDRIIITNHNDPKSCDLNTKIDLEGKITTTQNQNVLSNIHSNGEFFTMYVQEDPDTLDDGWVIDNAKIVGSSSPQEWTWIAQGLHD